MWQPNSLKENGEVNSSGNVAGSIQGNLDFILDSTDVKCIPNR